MKLLSLHPNRAFKLTKANTADNLVKAAHPEYRALFESFYIFSYKGACACSKPVEASFMMMNQVDSSSFDNDKVDDKKAKEWFQD